MAGTPEMTKTQTELVEALSAFVPADKRDAIVAGVMKMAEELKAELAETVGKDHQETKELIERLEEQRDKAVERAQVAEGNLAKIEEESAATIETMREAMRSEAKEQLEEAADRILKLEADLDELNGHLTEKFEDLRKSDRNKIIDRVVEYFDAKSDALVESVTEALKSDPDHANPANAITRIAAIVRESLAAESGEGDDNPLVEEIVALRGQIAQIEARNVRLSAQMEMMEGKKKAAEPSEEEQAAADAAAAAAATAEPVEGEEKKNEACKSEDEKSEDEKAAEKAADTKVSEAAKAEGPRASDLIREALTAASGKPTVTEAKADKAAAEGGDWLSEDAEATRDQQAHTESRDERAKAAEGRGIVNEATDEEAEDDDPSKKDKKAECDESQIIEGTGCTADEILKLAGLIQD